jgi:hypothetical protein
VKSPGAIGTISTCATKGVVLAGDAMLTVATPVLVPAGIRKFNCVADV